MIEINKIYNESCIETLSRIDDNSIDLTVTSPPYNMRLRVHENKYKKRSNDRNEFSNKYDHFSDDMNINEFYLFHKKVMLELLRTSKIICYNFQVVTGSKEAFFKIIGDFNEYIKDIVIWDKSPAQPAMQNGVLNSSFEFILIIESDKKKEEE